MYRFEFTSEEVTELVAAVIKSQVDDELFIKNYPDNKELIGSLKREIDRLQNILDKLRNPT